MIVRFGRSMSSQRRSQASETLRPWRQRDQPIPVTMPVALEAGQQLVHLGLGQMLPDPIGIVAAPSF
jgi:hypothetical protein